MVGAGRSGVGLGPGLAVMGPDGRADADAVGEAVGTGGSPVGTDTSALPAVQPASARASA